MADVPIAEQLNGLLAEAGLPLAGAELAGKLEAYLGVLVRWNARMNLTAVRDSPGILSRHFLESIACAHRLPAGVGTLLDFGSGAGFPGIPVALCRPEIAVTLAESQGKKAAFLQEAVRTLGISVVVYSARAELLQKRFDCVTLRAVDKMPQAVQAASRLVAPGGWVALMTTEGELSHLKLDIDLGLGDFAVYPLCGSEQRILALARRGAPGEICAAAAPQFVPRGTN
ncbi:MAG: 16S rRNA (guanine(527)-N(7))-methyltransferase RsmG [Terracidiphilus sp.]|jgi:16S rRNA (guanine527-N7)-methyltransferase